MSSMSRKSINLLMVWLLVGSPPLCRAGVFVDCCAHEPKKTGSESIAKPTCCEVAGHDTDSAVPDSDELPRNCASCAGVCKHVAKPSDDSSKLQLTPLHFSVFELVVAPAYSVGYALACSCLLPAMPFPASDLPLLI